MTKAKDFPSLLLLLAAVSAVFGARQTQQITGTAGGTDSELSIAAVFRVHDAVKFHVSRSHVNDLCTAAVIQQCVQLAASESSRATTSRLAEVLAAEESEVVAMLEALGVDVQGDFGCREFCEASAAHIPAILQTAAPSGPDKGCIDDACSLPTADVSQDALLHEGLQSPPTPPTQAQVDEIELSNMTVPSVLHPEVRGKMFFRAALNVVFGIFPAVGETDDESSADRLSDSLMESSEGVDAQLPPVAFGPRTLPRRHAEYRSNTVKAAAWISKAIRNLESGKSLVSKWFILGGNREKVDRQVVEARRHLRLMLNSMQWLHVRRGAAEDCSTIKEWGEVVGGTVAYVMKLRGCGVKDFKTCGQQDRQGRHITNICEFYWSRSLTDPVRVGTLVHESSHHFGTADHGYCDQVDCLRLSSTKARDNADTYTKLVEVLMPLKRETRSLLDPHPHCNTECGDSTFGDWKFDTKLSAGACGKCSVVLRRFGSCGHQKKMAENFFQKVCCSTRLCLKNGKTYVGFG